MTHFVEGIVTRKRQVCSYGLIRIVFWEAIIVETVRGANPAVGYYLPYLLGHGYRRVRLLLARHPDSPNLCTLAVMTG